MWAREPFVKAGFSVDAASEIVSEGFACTPGRDPVILAEKALKCALAEFPGRPKRAEMEALWLLGVRYVRFGEQEERFAILPAQVS